MRLEPLTYDLFDLLGIAAAVLSAYLRKQLQYQVDSDAQTRSARKTKTTNTQTKLVAALD